jgi:hypothetical protein
MLLKLLYREKAYFYIVKILCFKITGVCSQCGEKVVGEGSGCTAMDQVYHITCFTCQHCQIPLQGKPFYGLEGKPYCEEDYLVSF